MNKKEDMMEKLTREYGDNLDETIQMLKDIKENKRITALEAQKIKARERIELLKENKDFILGLLEHYGSGDHDKTPDSDGCRKCLLTEILNGYWSNDFEITFTVGIKEL